MTKKEFKLEKILTISAGDYCEMVGKSLRDYTAVGVHNCFDGHAYTGEDNVSFIERIPPRAEVVVDYRFAPLGRSAEWESGTALIPKK